MMSSTCIEVAGGVACGDSSVLDASNIISQSSAKGVNPLAGSLAAGSCAKRESIGIIAPLVKFEL